VSFCRFHGGAAAAGPYQFLQLAHLPFDLADVGVIVGVAGLQVAQGHFQGLEPGVGVHDPLPGGADHGGVRLDRGQLAFQVNLAVFPRPDLHGELVDFLFQALGLGQVELLQLRQDAFVLGLELGDLLADGLEALLNFFEFRLQKLGGGFGLLFPDFEIFLEIR
jgi:hypothetical protein